MNKTDKYENWLSRAKAEANKGIPVGERVVGIALVVFSIFMLFYYSAHQIRSTGFFTAKFGTMEMIMLYGSLIFWIISAGLEGVFGQRLLSRLFDAFSGINFVIIALTWLFITFPFDFEYFPNVLPDYLRFLVRWISNDIFRVILLLGIIVMGIAAVYSPIAYGFIDIKRLKRNK